MSEHAEILIIEDEQVVRRAAERILGAEGLQVDQAEDAEAGARMMQQNGYKVVLCDLMLPDGSGFAMIETAASMRPAPQVIMITGYATLENTIEAFRLGAFDFIPKPFDIVELQGVVHRAIGYYESLARQEESSDGSTPDKEDRRYFLGRHSWALVDPEGSATLGVAETFPGLLGEVEEIRPLGLDEHTVQGGCCCTITSKENLVYRVWAPLSGRIIAVNDRLGSEPELLNQNPFSTGWLVRIVPESLEEELTALEQR